MSTHQPTIVLVHGAFAESASWNGVISRLHDAAYTVIAASNPLRSLAGDASSVASVLDSVDGPVVAVGHSYGGAVVSEAVTGRADKVKALVYVAAFAPVEGESIAFLSGKFPGSTLGDTIGPVPLEDGTTDLYIRQDLYHQQFDADVPAAQSALDGAAQRPLRDVALNGEATSSAWQSIPSWFIWPELDKNIPPAAHRFMAERADAVEAIEVNGASHALPVSQPDAVADVIIAAAKHIQ
jgi:pimeloyl-ACP methyl ester carboxylesterase